jgi:hypothetical protein
MRTQVYGYSICKCKKVGMPVGPLAILDKVNLKCMLDVMIKDPNLMCHDFNLLQTLVTMTETHW